MSIVCRCVVVVFFLKYFVLFCFSWFEVRSLAFTSDNPFGSVDSLPIYCNPNKWSIDVFLMFFATCLLIG